MRIAIGSDHGGFDLKEHIKEALLKKDLEVLEPVRDFKARHASTLLVFDAVEEAIEQEPLSAMRQEAAEE